jgi:hypothetical protein
MKSLSDLSRVSSRDMVLHASVLLEPCHGRLLQRLVLLIDKCGHQFIGHDSSIGEESLLLVIPVKGKDNITLTWIFENVTKTGNIVN